MSYNDVAIFHRPDEQVLEPDYALALLKAGNKRYVIGESTARESFVSDRELLIEGQKPFAVILTCSDSRVSPEIYFDQGLGDLFCLRNAGNIYEKAVLGSMEYAVQHLYSPLIVVVGHSNCGAVTAACSDITESEVPVNLLSVLQTIKKSCSDDAGVEESAKLHVNAVVNEIKENVVIKQEGTRVVGAYYDLFSGEVSWL